MAIIKVVKVTGRSNPGTPGTPGAAGKNGRGIYATNAGVTITANGSVNKTSIAGGADNIAVGDTVIDSGGNAYSVKAVSGTAVTAGTKLFSIKGAQGSPGAGITAQNAIADLAAGADAATIVTKVNAILAALRGAGVLKAS